MTRDCDNLDGYVDNLLDVINDSNKTINMISHRIIFTSNYTHLFDPNPPQIIDDSGPNTFLRKEGEVLQALKKAIDQRNVKIKIITQRKYTNTNISFFNYKNVQVRTFDPAGNDLLLNEFATGDSKKLLFSSALFDNESFGVSRVVSLRSHYGPIIANDVDRFFKVTWAQLDSQENKTIPPIARFWDKKVEAITTLRKPYTIANGATVFIAESKQDILPPNRDDAMDVTREMISKASKRVLLSASYFNTEDNLFFQNSLAQAGEFGVPVRILLSHIPRTPGSDKPSQKGFQAMMRQAATLAGLHNISVNVCAPNTGVPNYMVIDDDILFASGPVAGALYGKSLGIAMVIHQKDLANTFETVFNEDWENSTSFAHYLDTAYSPTTEDPDE